MFGDEIILGNYTRKFDNKGRIVIGANAEEGEQLCILKEKDTEEEIIYRIVKTEMIKEKVLEIKRIREKAQTLAEMEKCDEAIKKLCESVYKKARVDAQGRLLVGNSSLRSQTAKLTGEVDSLKITVHR